MAKGDVFKITLRDGSIKAVVEEVLQDGNIALFHGSIFTNLKDWWAPGA